MLLLNWLCKYEGQYSDVLDVEEIKAIDLKNTKDLWEIR